MSESMSPSTHDTSAHDGADHEEHHEHEHRLMPHVLNLLALFALTLLTYGVALVHLGEPWGDIVALAIAMVKACLVIMIFMHVREATQLVKVAAFAGFFWVFLFFFYLWADVTTRYGWTVFDGWPMP